LGWLLYFPKVVSTKYNADKENNNSKHYEELNGKNRSVEAFK
jgi:hypothetical protein